MGQSISEVKYPAYIFQSGVFDYHVQRGAFDDQKVQLDDKIFESYRNVREEAQNRGLGPLARFMRLFLSSSMQESRSENYLERLLGTTPKSSNGGA